MASKPPATDNREAVLLEKHTDTELLGHRRGVIAGPNAGLIADPNADPDADGNRNRNYLKE